MPAVHSSVSPKPPCGPNARAPNKSPRPCQRPDAPSLITETSKQRSAGYIYGMMRNGRGAMPNYNRIEEPDRWDVANYVKALHAGTADTLPIGMPGQNGITVPGPSNTAPTKPSPYVHPTVVPTPGSPNINSATFTGGNDGGKTSKEKHQ